MTDLGCDKPAAQGQITIVSHPEKLEILLADENPANLRILQMLLHREGYQTIEAHSGQELLELARVRRPELLLIDVMLSDIDGFELCQQLRDDARTAELPVILFTARQNIDEKIRALEMGAADYIIKPFESVEVLARVRAQVRLRQLLREKIELQRELGQSRVAALTANMARGVAHNYLNLLTGIQGYVGLLEFSLTDDPELLDHLGQIKELIGRATHMTNDLSSCSRLMNMSLQEHELRDRCAELFQPLEGWAGRWRLHLEEMSGTGILRCHPSQLRRVMVILLTNAAESMPTGGTIRVKATIVRPNLELAKDLGQIPAARYLKLQISDQGRGLTAADAEKVFLPFFTTKATVGVGLSLAVAQAIIQSHSGTIRFESRLGRGSTVTIHLPVREFEPLPTPHASFVESLLEGQ